jgi:hypothetical protein
MIFSYRKIKNQGRLYNLSNNDYNIKISDYIQIENNILGYEPKLKIL